MNKQGLGLVILLVVLWLAVVLLAGQVAELERLVIRLEQSSDWYDEWIRSLEVDVDSNTLRTVNIMRRLSENGVVWG